MTHARRTPASPRSATTRRRFLGGAAALGTTVALGRAPAVLAQSRAPLRIGVLNSFSKVFAALANANLQGMQMYFDQIGGSIAGRKIELLHEDTEGNPSVGLQKARKLVGSDKIEIATGIDERALHRLRRRGPGRRCRGCHRLEIP